MSGSRIEVFEIPSPFKHKPTKWWVNGYRPTLISVWWQHPKWRIWIQVHPWETFHRWAFVRCEKCGGRFQWGADACGRRGSKAIWHMHCDEHLMKG